MREMRAIAFVTELIDDGKIDSNQYKRVSVVRSFETGLA
jgi:NTE family protein